MHGRKISWQGLLHKGQNISYLSHQKFKHKYYGHYNTDSTLYGQLLISILRACLGKLWVHALCILMLRYLRFLFTNGHLNDPWLIQSEMEQLSKKNLNCSKSFSFCWNVLIWRWSLRQRKMVIRLRDDLILSDWLGLNRTNPTKKSDIRYFLLVSNKAVGFFIARQC